MNQLIRIYATGLGSGFSPIAPGTAGSILGITIYWFLPDNFYVIIILILVAFFLGVLASTQMEEVYGKDAPQIVIDEVVGMWISIWALPKNWTTIILAFILFRLFDIWKPYPINHSQNFPNGWGVMIDDVIAGIYANLLLHALLVFGALQILSNY